MMINDMVDCNLQSLTILNTSHIDICTCILLSLTGLTNNADGQRIISFYSI